MEAFGPLILAALAISGLAYAVAAHALSVIARKTGHGDAMEILCWIPLLQIVPALAIGGNSLARCALGAVALVAANGALFLAAQVLGEGLGSILFGFGAAFSVLLGSFYFARISWNTALARELPGWFGLLIVVPGISFFIYPIMAFHDGWAWPHKVGPVLAALIAAVSISISYPIVMQQLESREAIPVVDTIDWNDWSPSGASHNLEQPTEIAPVAIVVEDSTPTRTHEPSSRATTIPADSQKSIRALFELKGRFDALEALSTADKIRVQEHRVRALDLVQSVRAELERVRSDLDQKIYTDLASHLVRVEARIHGQGLSTATNSGPIRRARSHTTRVPPIATAPGAPAALANDDAAPVRPFPVNVAEACPSGTELQSRTTEDDEEEWCQQLAEFGGLRHGWYARYSEGGRPEQVGEYRDGLRVGVWTRFYRSGAVRAQAEFEAGLQHGWLLSFDENGDRKGSARFAEGSSVD